MVAGVGGLVLRGTIYVEGSVAALLRADMFSGDELSPFNGTLTVVVCVLTPTDLETFLLVFCGARTTSIPSVSPKSRTWSIPSVKLGGIPTLLELSSRASSSRSASTTTLIRQGDSTEFGVAVILVGEWTLTTEVPGLAGVPGSLRFVGEGGLRFEGERCEGTEIEGPFSAERGSGDESYRIVGGGVLRLVRVHGLVVYMRPREMALAGDEVLGSRRSVWRACRGVVFVGNGVGVEVSMSIRELVGRW